MRDLVNQRNRINALYDRQAQAQAELKELNKQIAKWNDPAFVAVQARERLHFVMSFYQAIADGGQCCPLLAFTTHRHVW